MSTAYSPNVPMVQRLIRDAIAVMARLPDDFAPREHRDTIARSLGDGLPDTGLSAAKLESLRATYEAWPEGVLRGFHQASEGLAQMLQMFGARPPGGRIDPFDDLSSLDPAMLRLLTDAASMPRNIPMSGDAKVDVVNPAAVRSAVQAEVERRVMSAHTPFSATVTAMLGPDALRWLFAPNSAGSPYLQPHEFSRAGWIRLTRIRDQLEIEQELIRFGAQHAAHAKIVVCLAWTVAALASLMEPEVFLTERNPFLSSLRSANWTLSVGITNHTIVNFSPRSLRDVLQVLHDGLTSEIMTACDLMWIANGMARWRSIAAGSAGEWAAHQEQFSAFLSHRGCDAKLALVQAMLQQPYARGVFLDCLTLPRGVVNRSFVFGAIARSREVVVVDTTNFRESDWCLKELWFAEQLQKLGSVTLRRWSLAEAIQGVATTAAIETHDVVDRAYAIAPQVLSDARYWARSPNLHSLEKLRAIPGPLQRGEILAASDTFATEAAASIAAREAIAVLDAAVSESPQGEPIDLLASAAQLAVAILGANAKARSKMEVRARVDRMNAALLRMAEEKLLANRIFGKRASRYLACLASAVVSDLAGFRLDQLTAHAIREAIGDTAILRDGLLLFDVRKAGPQREFHMRFALSLLFNDVSAVGILQSADDHVHELEIDGRSLEVLPCVTLHPGMETLFTELSLAQRSRESPKESVGLAKRVAKWLRTVARKTRSNPE